MTVTPASAWPCAHIAVRGMKKTQRLGVRVIERSFRELGAKRRSASGKALSRFQTPEKSSDTEEDVFSMIKGQLDHCRKRSGWRAVNVWREVTSANTGNHPARKTVLASQKLIRHEAA